MSLIFDLFLWNMTGNHKTIKYEAHIYTKEELISFFKIVDNLPSSKGSPYKKYVAPVIFRLYYLCGMRLSEAINLKLEDVNFNAGYLLVQEAKGWKERKVYLSDELISMLKEYNQIISFLLPERKYFFQIGRAHV